MFPKPEKRKKKARQRLGPNISRRSLERLYKRLVRPAYLAGLAAGQGRRGDPAMCERCGERIVGEVHHLAGKEGENLVRAKNLGGLCRPCHDWIHGHPVAARLEGWMVSRHGASHPDSPDEERD